MTTLITGGTGNTGGALAKLLQQARQPVLIASRSGKASEPFRSVKFDWLDPTTFENPFKADSNIRKLYIVAPPSVYDPIRYVKPFIDLAVSHGVKRFVVLSGTQSNAGHGPLGAIQQYLMDLKVSYAVLRPTWFIENFSSTFYTSIREKNEMFLSAEDGRIPFVSVEDIAQAGFEALTAEQSPNRDYFIVGPELYSYDEAAKLLSSVLGREITHKRNSLEEQMQIFNGFMSLEYARHLAHLEHLNVNGAEEKIFNQRGDTKYLGKHTLVEYSEKNKHLWIK